MTVLRISYIDNEKNQQFDDYEIGRSFLISISADGKLLAINQLPECQPRIYETSTIRAIFQADIDDE